MRLDGIGEMEENPVGSSGAVKHKEKSCNQVSDLLK